MAKRANALARDNASGEEFASTSRLVMKPFLAEIPREKMNKLWPDYDFKT